MMKGCYVIMFDLFEVRFFRALSFLQICDLFEVGTFEKVCQFDIVYSSIFD